MLVDKNIQVPVTEADENEEISTAIKARKQKIEEIAESILNENIEAFLELAK